MKQQERCMMSSHPLNLPPVETDKPTPHEQQHQIAPHIRRQNPQIPPPRPPLNPKLLVKLIPDLESTVRAVRRRVRDQVTRTTGRKKRGHVFAAGLAGRGGEQVEFRGSADDGKGVEFGCDEARDEAGEAVVDRQWLSPKYANMFEARLTAQARTTTPSRTRVSAASAPPHHKIMQK